MSGRFAAILVVLLAVLGGGALLYQQQERARRPDNVASLGKPLLKDLQAADIVSIAITEPKLAPQATLTLQRKGERWGIVERADFAADFDKVREFVLKLIGLKIGQSEPVGEQDRARLNLDDPGKNPATAATRIELFNLENKSLGTLLVGRKYFKREVENPDKAIADGRFISLPAEAGTAYLVGDPLLQATARSAEWIERTAFKVEKVRTLELRYPDGSGWRIERAKDNADWKLAGARPGEKLDISRANAATYSLSLLDLADIAPKGASTDTKISGLDKPVLANATTFGGESYAIKVGKLAGDNYYVSFVPGGKVKDNEKALAEHVLLMPKSKLDDTLKKRAELLEKKDAKK